MADPDQISQGFFEALQDTGADQISQDFLEALASSGPDQISQLIAQAFQTTGPDQISQLTIELLRGPEIIPPADNPTQVFTFDAGLGNDYFLALQPSDSAIEGRDKVVKAVRVTGKVTNAFARVYAYGPVEDIDVDAVEAGTGAKTTVLLEDCPMVRQSKRHPVNVPNAMMHLIRVEGRWDGSGERDRIDEIFYEVSQQGIRR